MPNDNTDPLAKWREGWISRMMCHSQHPLIFWQAVVNRLTTDRLKLHRAPHFPLGQSEENFGAAFKFLVERNEQSLHFEKAGEVGRALILYEANIADCFYTSSPYECLRVIYTEWRWYEDALRVCETYLADRQHVSQGSQDYFKSHVSRLMRQLRVSDVSK
jgi:hypothetical protein